MANDATPEVQDNAAASRFEIRVGDEIAGFAEYRLRGDRIVFTHTEIADAFEGHGLGSALAHGALDEARARGLRVVPRCPFIKKYIEEHEEYAELVGSD